MTTKKLPHRNGKARSSSGRLVRPLHRVARIRPGYWNYRGYCFERDGRGVVMLNEEGITLRSEPNIRSMCGWIDRKFYGPNTGHEPTSKS